MTATVTEQGVLCPKNVREIFEAKIGTSIDPEALTDVLRGQNVDLKIDNTPSDMGGLGHCPPKSVTVQFGNACKVMYSGYRASVTRNLHDMAAAILGYGDGPN